jgi:hypothetical protein
MPLGPVYGLHFEALGAVEEVHFFGDESNPAACFIVLSIAIPGIPGGRIRYRTTVYRDTQVTEIALQARRESLIGRPLLLTGVPITGVFTGYQLTEVVHGALQLPGPAKRNRTGLSFAATGTVEAFTVNGPVHTPVSATIVIACKAPGLPGGIARYRATLLRHAQLESAAHWAAQGKLVGSVLTLRGIPMGSRQEGESAVEVLMATLENRPPAPDGRVKESEALA